MTCYYCLKMRHPLCPVEIPNIFHPKPITASAEVDLRKYVLFLRLRMKRAQSIKPGDVGTIEKNTFNKCQFVPLPTSRCQPGVGKESNTNYKGKFYQTDLRGTDEPKSPFLFSTVHLPNAFSCEKGLNSKHKQHNEIVILSQHGPGLFQPPAM